MDCKDEEKKERLLAALERGMVMIHLDARRQGVLVPKHLAQEPHLRLNLSYRFEPPDLSVGEWGVRSTLSFAGTRFQVAVPWSALFAITSHASREFWLYPDDMPRELIEQAIITQAGGAREEAKCSPEAKRKTLLREVAGEKCDDADDDPEKPRSRGHLRVIK
jgi:stringent starvation protein B